MYHHQHQGPPDPPPYQGRRRYPSPPDRWEEERQGRSRTQERKGQGRRFRSSDPVGSRNERHNGTFHQGDIGEGAGERRRKEAEIVQELEELRGRAGQMEKTMR